MKLPSSSSDLVSIPSAKQSALGRTCGLAVVSLLVLGSAVTYASDEAQATSYHLDWVPFDQLTPEQKRETKGLCRGLYVHPEVASRQDSEITAKEATYEANGQVQLMGDVRAYTPNGILQADKAKISSDRSNISAEGNLVVRQATGIVYGQSGTLNNQSETFDIRNAEYLIFQDNFRGRAERIQRNDSGLVVIEDGSYTSCSPDDKSWQLVGSEIELDNESGFGTAIHARLELADIPVFYWPYLKFPIDERRHTGLLMPSFAIDEEGLDHFKQPLYLNLASNYDATLTPHWYRERGTHLGTEFRYLFPDNHYGIITYDFLEADPLFEDKKREFFAYQSEGSLTDNWIYRVDYGQASDDYYFRAFETNFIEANTEKLDQLSETQYRNGNWHYLARAQGFQELDPNLTDAGREYYKLPELQANYANRIGDLSFGSHNQAVWFDRDILDGSDIEGSVSPTTGAITWGSALIAQRTHLEPFAQYRASRLWGYTQLDLKAAYSQYALSGQPDGISGSKQRLLPTFALDSGLFFERETSGFGSDYIQTLEPRIKLVYAPTEDQYDIPVFDTSEYSFDRNQLFRDSRFSGVDRQGDLQKLAFGVTSRFINDASGREVLNLTLGQALYMQERTVTLSTDPTYEPDYQHSRLVSPLVASVGYYPLDWLTVDLSSQWNTDKAFFFMEQRETKITGTHPTGLAFLLRHTKNYTGCMLNQDCSDTQDITYTETADLGVIAPLNENWKAFGVIRRDIQEGRHLERIAGIEYESCCWAIRLARHQFYAGDDYDDPEAFDNNVRLELLLKGFGGIGQEEPYERAAEFIPGFRSSY
ncbi:LPS-assembly protein LptD [Oceanospirillum sanctuarii]|uniref:LPS-assembly protein LptD n=1 Tax=Oceanospirillum sanctuarii TaxID=1434821 RepID=UPI000A3AF7BF|nr:LPS assembly protein LptD [Oceanospirillum sanctuarii]